MCLIFPLHPSSASLSKYTAYLCGKNFSAPIDSPTVIQMVSFQGLPTEKVLLLLRNFSS
jgi:hypothetical protein